MAEGCLACRNRPSLRSLTISANGSKVGKVIKDDPRSKEKKRRSKIAVCLFDKYFSLFPSMCVVDRDNIEGYSVERLERCLRCYPRRWTLLGTRKEKQRKNLLVKPLKFAQDYNLWTRGFM